MRIHKPQRMMMPLGAGSFIFFNISLFSCESENIFCKGSFSSRHKNTITNAGDFSQIFLAGRRVFLQKSSGTAQPMTIPHHGSAQNVRRIMHAAHNASDVDE